MTRLRAVGSLLVAAALTAVAVATAEGAGCDDPGRYVLGADGYVLVGGCIAPGDIVVPDPLPEPALVSDVEAPTKG